MPQHNANVVQFIILYIIDEIILYFKQETTISCELIIFYNPEENLRRRLQLCGLYIIMNNNVGNGQAILLAYLSLNLSG